MLDKKGYILVYTVQQWVSSKLVCLWCFFYDDNMLPFLLRLAYNSLHQTHGMAKCRAGSCSFMRIILKKLYLNF
jgi:hypothetical protein